MAGVVYFNTIVKSAIDRNALWWFRALPKICRARELFGDLVPPNLFQREEQHHHDRELWRSVGKFSRIFPQAGPTLLNFSDRTRTGVFNVVWPLPREEGEMGQSA